MRSTGRWVEVLRDRGDSHPTVRMLHNDRRGRECVRYEKEWRLVEKVNSPNRARYFIGKLL